LLDAIGGYVDTASRHEFRDALQAHRTGPVIERVMAADGSVISHRSDWVAYVDAPGFFASEVAERRFILSGHSENIRWTPRCIGTRFGPRIRTAISSFPTNDSSDTAAPSRVAGRT